MRVSADFNTIVQQITLGQLGLTGGSIQGVTEDTSDGSYFMADNANDRIIHVSAAGALIGTPMAFSTANGIAYDAIRDCLILMTENTGIVTWVNKSDLSAFGKTGIATDAGDDQLYHDPLRDELMTTLGGNGTQGQVKVFDCSSSTAPTLIATITCDHCYAIEGVSRLGNDLYMLSDQNTHTGVSPEFNQVQFYPSALVDNSFGIGVDGPSSAAEASGAVIYTINVARYGSYATGDITGNWDVVAGGGNPADAADFGGAFPSGTFTIPDGNNSVNFSVLPSDDSEVEGDETYRVSVVSGGKTASRLGIIANDDTTLPDVPQAISLGTYATADPSYLKQSNAGSGAVSADGDPVGFLQDQSANGWNYASTADDANRPTFRTAAGVNWLELTGTESDALRHIGHAMNLWGSNGFTLSIAFRSAQTGSGHELFAQGNSSSGNTAFMFGSSASAGYTAMFLRTDGGTQFGFTNICNNGFSGVDRVLTIVGNGTTLTAYIDGVATFTNINYDRGANAATFDNMAIGAWLRSSGLTHFFTSTTRIYGVAAWPGVQFSDTDRATLLTHMAALQGRTL